MTNGTISEKCEELYNKLNSFVTSVINRDVTPKISNLNTEVWGSNIQTGDSRIDTLESDVTSLSDSITNKVDTVYTQTLALSSGVWTGGNSLYLYRVGKLVVAFIPSAQLKYASTGWKDMITLPNGFHPRFNTPLAVINNASETFNQWRTNNNVLQVYCATANTSAYTGCFGVWVTNEDYPSQ